ncbi:MAG TPA: EI24 domain-containing protein [Casimicrobiaceae bacterium]|nr:EI24 domain-containing protein [Casimicrobiaceae bacterium]
MAPDSAWRAIVRAMRRALPLVFSPRLLGALAGWLLGACVAWLVIGLVVYTTATDALAEMLGNSIGDRIFAALIVMAALALAALLTALCAIAVFTMPTILRLVAQRHFPALERRRGGTIAGSVGNLIVAVGVFLPLWLASFLLLAIPPLYVLASWALTGWLNQRLFRYDALAEHADRAELAALPRAMHKRLWLLGFVLAPLALVPIVDLFLPLFAGIAFACLCLDALAQWRGRGP